jgi:hypothetical protein
MTDLRKAATQVTPQVTPEVTGDVGMPIQKREWVGLDEVEVIGMTCECVDDGTFNMDCAHDFARAIEESLRRRNT